MGVYRVDNRRAPIDWEANGQTARTLQNVKNILMTKVGEVPYDRLRGIRRALYDMPIAEARKVLASEMSWALEIEPDAKLIACRCYFEGEYMVI